MSAQRPALTRQADVTKLAPKKHRSPCNRSFWSRQGRLKTQV